MQFWGVRLFRHSSHWVLLVWWTHEHLGFRQPTSLEDEDSLGMKEGIVTFWSEEGEKEQFLQT